ncbi:MAG TPA: adenylyltransferase/cytidyltransferase family protein [Patescibacteria group bacterium]
MTKRGGKIILEAAAVVPFVEKYRQQGKKIVLTQGSFDLVHIGHARYCREAKKHGDILIVGVDSDEKVRTRKGPDRPVVPEDERLEMLTYLSAVDHVVLKELNAPKYNLIKLIRPDVLIATKQTYTEDKIKQLEKICGKVVVLEPRATTSTSAKIRRLQIGFMQKIGAILQKRMSEAMDDILKELQKEL